jgi:N-acetylmuramoyl-L-alanine amidase
MKKFQQFRVVIDPGHGGKDSGAIGDFSKEKELNMIFSNKLFDILMQDPRFLPMLTREADVYLTLSKRVLSAIEADAHVFLSMHCNASVSSKPHDCQIYYNCESKDKPLAELLFTYVDKIDHDTSKWSREIYGNFYVLRKLNMDAISAVLVEIGFISNTDDENLLNDPDFQNKFCYGLYNGLKTFFNIN